jgi:3-hydroxy-9,10-secoandrosta-1,3,5(10)-triene-9,17-dione monooxygenase
MEPRAIDDVWGGDPSSLISSAYRCVEGSIEKVLGGYRIAGRFGFSSGCHHSSWVMVAGVPSNAPKDGFLTYLIPAADFRIDDNWHVMGLCGTGSCDVVVDATVPAHRVLSLTAAWLRSE